MDDSEVCPAPAMDFTENHQAGAVLENLWIQREKGRFCDLILHVQGQQFEVHQNVLAACSPYFDGLLKPINNGVKNELVILCQNMDAFQYLLKFIYTGTVSIDGNNVCDMLVLANHFLVEKLKNYCADYLNRYIDESNCLRILDMSEEFDLPVVKKNVYAYIVENISEVLEWKEILEYSILELNNLLKFTKKSIPQYLLLNFICRWVAHDVIKRESEFQTILQQINWECVRNKFVQNLIQTNDLFHHHPKCLYILLACLEENKVMLPEFESKFRCLKTFFESDSNKENYLSPNFVDSSLNKTTSILITSPETMDLEEVSNSDDNNLNYACNTDTSSGDSVPSLESKKHPLVTHHKEKVLTDAETSSETQPESRHLSTPNIQSFSNCSSDSDSNDVITNIDSTVDLDDQNSSRDDLSTHQIQVDSNIFEKLTNLSSNSTEDRPVLPAKLASKQTEPSSNLLFQQTIQSVSAPALLYLSKVTTDVSNINLNSDGTANVSSKLKQKHRQINSKQPPKRKKTSICTAAQDPLPSRLPKKRKRKSVRKPSIKNISETNCDETIDSSIEGPVGDPKDKAVLQLGVKCNSCSFVAHTAFKMERHLKTVHREIITHECFECDFTCTLNRDYLVHLKTHFSGPPYFCKRCKYTDDRFWKLLQHIIRQHVDVGHYYKCSQCDYASPVELYLQNHMKIHTRERNFICEICERGFKTKPLLNQHRGSHSQDQPFLCDECGFRTRYKSMLITHKRIHTGNVLRCNDCSYSTPIRKHFVVHRRMHDDIRPFACETCGKAFHENNKLTRHLQVHREHELFECRLCNYSSSLPGSRLKHMKRKHREKVKKVIEKVYKSQPNILPKKTQHWPQTNNSTVIIAAPDTDNSTVNTLVPGTGNSTSSTVNSNDKQDVLLVSRTVNGVNVPVTFLQVIPTYQ